MVNKVILIGNLGKDPEVRHLESGVAVAKFSVATNESYRDKSGEWQTLTEWHDVVMWRNQAERAEKTLKKGSTIYVEGKLTHRKWQDKEGIDRYTTEVVANYFRLLDKRDSSSQGGYENSFPTEAPVFNERSSSPVEQPLAKQVTELGEDDLPF